MKNSFNHILGSFLIAGVLAGCSSASSSEKKETTVVSTPPIETLSLQKGLLGTSLQLPGELIAFQQVDLYAKVTSYVKEMRADIGTQVTAGQMLMRLEAPELTAQLAAAESRYKSQEALYHASNATYNRLLETSKTPGTISQNDLDIASARKNSDLAQFEAAKAAYREVNVMRGYLEIRAPFSGVITARNVNLGAYVGPTGKGSELPLFTLQEQKHLRLAVAVPEAYAGYLKDGDAVTFKVKSLPGENFNAKVKRLAGALDLRLRSERIEMDIDNSNRKLLPGMVAELDIPLNSKDSTFVIPGTALVRSDEGTYVIKSDNGTAKKVPVKKGRELDGKVEIYGGLEVGDVLVTKATEELRDGTALSKK